MVMTMIITNAWSRYAILGSQYGQLQEPEVGGICLEIGGKLTFNKELLFSKTLEVMKRQCLNYVTSFQNELTREQNYNSQPCSYDPRNHAKIIMSEPAKSLYGVSAHALLRYLS